MAKREDHPIPKSLSRARAEFLSWRARRSRGARIPDRLWAFAVEAAREEGITRTIQTLSLDYYALKQRMEEAGSAPVSSELEETLEFVEIPWSAAGSKRSCTIELQAREGQSLRLELEGLSATDIATVVRGLWRVQG